MQKRFVFFYAISLTFLVTIAIYIANLLDKEEKNEKSIQEKKESISQITKYIEDNKIKENIKLKISNTGEVVDITVSDYLKGVLPSEMPPDYDLEALKAQAVVARTYLYNKMSTNSHEDADICDNFAHCQAYYSKEQILKIWEKSKGYNEQERKKYMSIVEEAVDSTQNIAITYKGKYIKAYFHACSGGRTENIYNIWGKQKIPYLTSVESIEDKSYRNYTSTVKFTIGELQAKLNKDESVKCSVNENDLEIVKILTYTDTGRVDKVQIGGVIYTAESLRTSLGLRSTNFKVEYKDGKVIFNVIGNGHGVGMSQVGANYYAKQGMTYDKIITHYYKDVDVTYINKEEKTNENKI